MSGHGSSGGGGNPDRRVWEQTRHDSRPDGGGYTHTFESETTYGGHGGGSHESKGKWGWGKTVLLVGALAAGGAAAWYGKDLIQGDRAPVTGPVTAGDDGERNPATTTPPPAETPADATVEETEARHGALTFSGNIGQLEMEIPNTYAENQDVMVTLVFENQAQLRACEDDLNCAEALQGVPNSATLGALTGVFAVFIPEGEPNKRMISRSVPATVTWLRDGQPDVTITIDPATTRVRVGEGEFVPLREVLGEARD